MQVKECDERLLSINVTHFISRTPRSLEEFNRWKGNCNCIFIGFFNCFYAAGAELRNWLLFYCLPVLSGILPQPFFGHLALLVAAIYIYSAQKISVQDHKLAEDLLLQFYKDFSVHYGN